MIDAKNDSIDTIVETTIHHHFRPKSSGLIPRGLTLSAVLIIVAMLAVILINVIYGGLSTISWEFLSHPPENGAWKQGASSRRFSALYSWCS